MGTQIYKTQLLELNSRYRRLWKFMDGYRSALPL